MVDPNTRQKVGHSDITEVLLEQIETFSGGRVKVGQVRPTKTRRRWSVVHRYWPRIGELLEEQRAQDRPHEAR
jgi:hypothetical protein